MSTPARNSIGKGLYVLNNVEESKYEFPFSITFWSRGVTGSWRTMTGLFLLSGYFGLRMRIYKMPKRTADNAVMNAIGLIKFPGIEYFSVGVHMLIKSYECLFGAKAYDAACGDRFVVNYYWCTHWTQKWIFQHWCFRGSSVASYVCVSGWVRCQTSKINVLTNFTM